MTNLDSILESRDVNFANKGPSSQGYGFSSWAPKNWCFWAVVWEKTLESPLDCKEIQPVHHKGDQSWVFSGRDDAEAETPILWPPHAKSWLIGKDPDAGKDWKREEKGTTKDEMVGWHQPSRWTWVWVNSGSWWWTERPGVLQSTESQRVGHNWVNELNRTEEERSIWVSSVRWRQFLPSSWFLCPFSHSSSKYCTCYVIATEGPVTHCEKHLCLSIHSTGQTEQICHQTYF